MIKFNQKGMTLVEILMALGISAGITLVGAQLMGEYYSNQNYTEVQADIQKTMIQAQRVMGDKEICNKIFNAYPLSETFSPVRFVTAIKGKTPSNPALTEQDVITLGNKGKYNINRIWIARNENNENLKNIVFEFTWPNKKFIKSETFIKSFSIFVARDSDNNRWSCGEVVGENSEIMKQELCLSLNGDNTNPADAFVEWVGGECKVKQFRCERNQIPMRLSSLGRFICTDITTVLTPDSLIDTNPVNCPAGSSNIGISWDGSKYVLSCSPGTPSCTPVNGGWTPWVEVSTTACSGGHIETRTSTQTRSCTNPTPNSCGLPCPSTPPDGTATTRTENIVCSSLKFMDGITCTYGGLPGIANCGDCENVPTVSIPACCDAINGFYQIYSCGGQNASMCRNSSNVNHGTTAPAHAPPSYECDT